MRLMPRLLLAALVGAAVIVVGLALVGDNSFGVLGVALAWGLVIGFIGPFGSGGWPTRRG